METLVVPAAAPGNEPSTVSRTPAGAHPTADTLASAPPGPPAAGMQPATARTTGKGAKLRVAPRGGDETPPTEKVTFSPAPLPGYSEHTAVVELTTTSVRQGNVPMRTATGRRERKPRPTSVIGVVPLVGHPTVDEFAGRHPDTASTTGGGATESRGMGDTPSEPPPPSLTTSTYTCAVTTSPAGAGCANERQMTASLDTTLTLPQAHTAPSELRNRTRGGRSVVPNEEARLYPVIVTACGVVAEQNSATLRRAVALTTTSTHPVAPNGRGGARSAVCVWEWEMEGAREMVWGRVLVVVGTRVCESEMGVCEMEGLCDTVSVMDLDSNTVFGVRVADVSNVGVRVRVAVTVSLTDHETSRVCEGVWRGDRVRTCVWEAEWRGDFVWMRVCDGEWGGERVTFDVGVRVRRGVLVGTRVREEPVRDRVLKGVRDGYFVRVWV